jgi:predicted transcriptional regulator
VLAALLNAPEDDEPETDYERQSVAEAMDDLKAGRVVTSDEILDDIS